MNARHQDPPPGSGLTISGLSAGYGNSPAVFDIDLEVGGSEFVTLLGPSGCGKTTTLRCVGGLHTPSAGEIRLEEKAMFGPGVNLPPDKRDINMVFQSYAVWPHMTALENVAYGLRAKKVGKSKAHAKAREMLELVGLEKFEKRHATDLSGGQQQRVALARALATEPGLVLMDEPLSNLDAQLRARMRDEIRQIQRTTGTTVLYVTHDQSEALSMSDRVVVMHEGRIQQIGDPWALYHRPANAFVATFVGEANMVPGTVGEVRADSFSVSTPSLGNGTVLDIALASGVTRPSIGDSISVVFRPEWVSIGREEALRPAEVRRNEVFARLLTSEFLGDHFERRYQAGEHVLRVQAVTGPTSQPPRIGSDQTILLTPENITWFPSDAGASVPAAEAENGGMREVAPA